MILYPCWNPIYRRSLKGNGGEGLRSNRYTQCLCENVARVVVKEHESQMPIRDPTSPSVSYAIHKISG